jgi:hypothetical protein
MDKTICLILLVVSAVISGGCVVENSSPTESTQQGTSTDSSTESPLSGNWSMSMYYGDNEVTTFMLTISEGAKDKYDISMKELAKNVNTMTMTNAEIVMPNIMLQFRMGKQEMMFLGNYADEQFLGVIKMQDGSLVYAKLQKTLIDNLQGVEGSQKVEEATEYQKAAISDNLAESLTAFIKMYPDSHLVHFAYSTLVNDAARRQIPEKEILALVSDEIKATSRWGSVLLPQVYAATIKTLGEAGISPHAIEGLIAQANSLPDVKMTEAMQEEMNYGLNMAQMGSDNPEQQAHGFDALNKVLTKKPQEVLIRYQLMLHALKKEDWTRLVDLGAIYVIFPGYESILMEMTAKSIREELKPSVLFSIGWEKLKRTPEELKTLLNNEYVKFLGQMDAETVSETIPEIGSPVLIEMFTGASCPPCVAVDVALSIATNHFDHHVLNVIRYHQHIPEPDALATRESEQRYSYYVQKLKTGGTPMVIVNGSSLPPMGGTIIDAASRYVPVKKLIEGLFKQEPKCHITATAEVQNNEVLMSGSVDKLPSPATGWKVVVVLVESELIMLTPNGLTRHEMVARSLPFGRTGLELTAEETSFECKVDIVGLRNMTEAYLRKFEENIGGKFSHHPIDFKKLGAVVFLQNEQTREVASSLYVPINHDFELPPYVEPTATNAGMNKNAGNPDAQPAAIISPTAPDGPENLKTSESIPAPTVAPSADTSKPEAKVESTDSKPTESKPAEIKPTENKPTESKPEPNS